MPNALQSLISAHEDYVRLCKEATIAALPEYFAPVFDADPRVNAIVWGQWAPYFNDGEPCRFGLHYERSARGKTSDDPNPYETLDESDPLYEEGYWSPTNRIAATLLEAIPLTLLERFCEDGVIQVTRDGVKIFEYSHD